VQVNYFGCYHTARALLPGMLARRAGHLCFVSSMIYVNPMAGFSSYAPSKAAVRALADCLRSETQGTGVSISVAYPPDTQTPGFDKENETKPGATQAICASFQETVYSADAVAKVMWRGLRAGRYHLLNPDPLHALGLSMSAGMTPRPRWLIVEVLLAPVMVIVAAVSYMIQDRIVRRFHAAALASIASGGGEVAAGASG
jgi:3-dehydrosphinganine reductase